MKNRYYKLVKNNLFFLIVTMVPLLVCAKPSGAIVKSRMDTNSHKLAMPVIFCDNMILQRDKLLSFWGKCLPGSKVTVSFNKKTATTKGDNKGDWKLKLPAMKAGGPYVLEVFDEDGNKLSYKNILLGDVWICAGQSNMNFILAAEQNGKEEMASLSNPDIREYRCKMPEGVQNPENNEHSKWISAVGGSASNFSAVAYYFAKEIQKSQHVPVGILVMSCGDTRAESWMPETAIKDDPLLGPLNEYLNLHQNGNSISFNHRPAEFYNVIVKDLIPFEVKGVIWYQGESNALPDNSGRTILERASEYKALLKRLIHVWRSDRDEPDLPFYLVQLPAYKDPSGNLDWSLIREAQYEVSKEIKHSGLAVTIDLGDGVNLHPVNKRDVGHRLSLQALSKTYGVKGLNISGPVAKDITIRGDKAVVSFDFANKGLGENGTVLTGFEISDVSSPDVFVKARAYIAGTTVICSDSSIQKPAAVRYAWTDSPEASLFNSEKLPAVPFLLKVR